MGRGQRPLEDEHMHTHSGSDSTSSLLNSQGCTAGKEIFNRTTVLNAQVRRRRSHGLESVTRETYAAASGGWASRRAASHGTAWRAIGANVSQRCVREKSAPSRAAPHSPLPSEPESPGSELALERVFLQRPLARTPGPPSPAHRAS